MLNSADLYFQLAKAEWYFNIDGVILDQGTPVWTKTASPKILRGDKYFDIIGLGGTGDIVPGMLVPVTTGSIFNNVINGTGSGWTTLP